MNAAAQIDFDLVSDLQNVVAKGYDPSTLLQKIWKQRGVYAKYLPWDEKYNKENQDGGIGISECIDASPFTDATFLFNGETGISHIEIYYPGALSKHGDRDWCQIDFIWDITTNGFTGGGSQVWMKRGAHGIYRCYCESGIVLNNKFGCLFFGRP
jgi:hypothetical protein